MARLLLDTHVALWWFTAHPRLTPSARALIANAECHISAVVIWEVAVKHKLGKLPVAPETLLASIRAARVNLVSITPEHTVATAALPLLHGDHFDRLLIAQARCERLQLLTADSRLGEYGEDILLLPQH